MTTGLLISLENLSKLLVSSEALHEDKVTHIIEEVTQEK